MELVGVVKFSKTHSKVISVVGAAALVAFIALCNWRITARIPLGFLYLVPMFLFERWDGVGLFVWRLPVQHWQRHTTTFR